MKQSAAPQTNNSHMPKKTNNPNMNDMTCICLLIIHPHTKKSAAPNLHHGDSDVASLLDDHGFISGLQFWHWQATKGEVHAWCRVRGASWEPLQLFYVVLLNRFLLRDRHSFHLNLQIKITMFFPEKIPIRQNSQIQCLFANKRLTFIFGTCTTSPYWSLVCTTTVVGQPQRISSLLRIRDVFWGSA